MCRVSRRLKGEKVRGLGGICGLLGWRWTAVVAEMVAETSAGQLRQAEVKRMDELAN
jgi:hypothetical protein